MALQPIVCVVGFHHARFGCQSRNRKYLFQLTLHRGPEVEGWYGVDEGVDPAVENDWAFLPFMALSDGAHAYVLHQANTRSKAPEALKALQFHRRLLLFYTPSQGFTQKASVLRVWHLMHATAGCYRIDRPPSGRHKKHGAESCGSNSRQSTILRRFAREAEHGHWSLVRTKVQLDLNIQHKDHSLKRQQRLHRCRHLEGW